MMDKRIINYRGYSIELGELEGDRKAYWKVPFNANDDALLTKLELELGQQHEVECGSWADLERIAKRNIDAAQD